MFNKRIYLRRTHLWMFYVYYKRRIKEFFRSIKGSFLYLIPPKMFRLRGFSLKRNTFVRPVHLKLTWMYRLHRIKSFFRKTKFS